MKPLFLAVLGFVGGCTIMGLISYAEVDMSFLQPHVEVKPVISVPTPAVGGNQNGLNASSIWGQPEDDARGTVLILAEPKDVAWLSTIPYPSIVMTKGQPAGTPNNVPDGKAFDGTQFLRFILDNYHDLPPRMFFINGASVPEFRPQMPETIANIDVRSYPYAGFSNLFTCFRAHAETKEGKYMRACWAELNGDELIDVLPTAPFDMISSSCCSNFLVRREQILRNPISLYQTLYDWSLTSKLEPDNVKSCLSYMWHKVFGKPWRNYQIDPNLLCPKKPSTCAHEHHVYPLC